MRLTILTSMVCSSVVLRRQSRLELGLCVSVGFSRANDLYCWRASGRRSTLRCACGWKADGVCGTRIGDSEPHGSMEIQTWVHSSM